MESGVLESMSDPHPLLSLVSAVFWVTLWLLSWARALVAFATISIPRFIYSILSYSMTLTLNFWNFALIFVISAIGLNYWIRFKYLDVYTQLKEPPLVKADINELHPDVNTEPPPPFHNYLDDFLQAVRVFGFLEKPVFHELARHLQTRRLIAGDSMSLDQDKSFYCVIDGTVQVYAQTGTPNATHPGTWEDENMNGYQLINEVGSGGTLSSLFTILSLFTEDVKLRWPEDDAAGASEMLSPPSSAQRRRANSDISHFDLESSSRAGNAARKSSISSVSTIHPQGVTSPRTAHSDSPDHSSLHDSNHHSASGSEAAYQTTVRPGLVARAAEDTTLAVIPAEAFRRLTQKFPKATGHIVQVILTRFSRVTFSAAHKYLGLTSEVLRTEKAINEIACHPLPASFYEGGGLQYLRQRFDGAASTASDPDTDYTSFSQSPTLVPSKEKTRPSLTFPRQRRNGKGSDAKPTAYMSQATHPSRRQSVHAGDLLVSSGGSSDPFKSAGRPHSNLSTPHIVLPDESDRHRLTTKSIRDDFDLKEAVMSCIAKSIGLLQPPLSSSDSPEGSPAFNASGSPRDPRHSETYSSPFGSLSLLDLGDDVSSVTGSTSMLSSGGRVTGLDNEVEILFYPAGSTLVHAGEHNTGLYYVIDGFLDILVPRPDHLKTKSATKTSELGSEGSRSHLVSLDEEKLLFTVKPGGIAGYLASLCNTASYVDIKAKTDAYVGFLPSDALERLLEKRPIVLLTLAKRLISMLSPLVSHIDASLDWMQVDAGQVLWRPNDVSDSFYIVINGRLRAITESEKGVVNIEGEYGQGDSVGELDVITSSPRRTTVHAIRDTELIRMPQTLFNAISARNPQTTAQLLRMIASRVRDEIDASPGSPSRNTTSELGHNNTNLKTVAILPITRSVPVNEFARKLHAALEAMGASTSYLNQTSISTHLGRHAFTRMGKLKAAGWLADQEQRYRTVLYVADSPVNSSWTQTCIRQADCVMIVGMGDDPSLGEYERLLLSMKTTARRELVLLHPDRSVVPGSTREWLKNRPWVHQHLHVQLPGIVQILPKAPPASKDPDAVVALKNLKDKVQNEIQKYRKTAVEYRPQRPSHTNDFARLARRICGKSIGLVLGGGGARGVAHLGLIQALEERGIPIDHIGGTSIGAFMGALYAREGDLISSSGRAKQFGGRLANIWRMLSDVTYPLVAYTTGHEFNRSMYKAFYDLHIEDMWLPYFCNTTNINTSRMNIHETGYAWRYIRASMTLVGLLPPLCDNGCMLVDGGYLDNLPVSTMLSMGANVVFACDVGSLDDNSPRHFGDTVSGWWLLLNRWNPFSNARLVPAITEIQSRLAYVSSVNTLEDAKVMKGSLYIGMPVQDYGTLQWGKFEEIRKIGYQTALSKLQQFEDEGRLPSPLLDGTDAKLGKKKGQSARRNSI